MPRIKALMIPLLWLILLILISYSPGITAGTIDGTEASSGQRAFQYPPSPGTFFILGVPGLNNRHYSLSKLSSSKATITHLIQDSIAIYDYSKGRFVPSAIKANNYAANGSILSSEIKILNDSLAWLESMLSLNTICSTDANGSIISATVQWMPNNTWVNYFKSQYNPALNDTLFSFDNPNGNGYYLACLGYSSSFFILSMKSFTMQQWNITSNTWINFIRDSVISRGSGVFVNNIQAWDTISNSYKLSIIDSVFTSGSKVFKVVEYAFSKSDTIKTVSAGTFDAAGNETEEMQIKSKWNNPLKTWQYQAKTKYIQTYDNHGNVLQSIAQDSTDNWTPLDSCGRMLFNYSYDNSGLVTSRIDSTWNKRNGGIKDIHWFKYQTFSPVINPVPFAGNSHNQTIRIHPNGMVEAKTPITVSIYSFSGKCISIIAVNSSSSLWGSCKNSGERVSKGVYLAKVNEMKMAVTVWNE